MSNYNAQGSLTSVSDPVGHIAPKKRDGTRKIAMLSWVILSLVLISALAASFTVRSAAASKKDHMRTVAKDHMRMVAKDHMRAVAKDHMDA